MRCVAPRGTNMRVHWWQRIRWRLAFGSMFVVLLATILLATLVILALPYYYGIEERAQLSNVATGGAERIGVSYAESHNLAVALRHVLPQVFADTSQSEGYLLVVLNHSNQLVYPPFPTLNKQPGTFTRLLQAA